MREKTVSLMSFTTNTLRQRFMEKARYAVSSDFVRKVGETFATRIFLIGIGLITTVLVARILGPEGRGLYAVATTVSAFGVQFGNLGLHASNTYSVAKDRSLLPHLVGNTMVVCFGLGTIGAIITHFFFMLWPSLAPVNGVLLDLSLVFIPFGLSYLLLQNLLIGINEVRAYNVIELFSKCIAVLFILVIIALGNVTVERVLIAGLSALILSVLWIYRRIRHHLAYAPNPSYPLFKSTFRYGLKAYLAAFFAFLVLRCNILMIQYMLGAEQAGYYSIAATMADLVNMLPVVVGTIMFPKLSAMNTQLERYTFARKTAFLVGIVMTIVTIATVALAEPIVKMFFGAAFAPSIPAFIWLAPGIIICSVNTILMIYFASNGMPIITVYSPACAAIAAVILNTILIPKFGIVGASVSTSVTYVIMITLSFLYIVRSRGITE